MPFPNIRLTNRPLHFIYICDCSGSMAAHGKMQALNQAIRQSLPGMVKVAGDNPEARVLVRAVSFSNQADWHISVPTPVEELQWVDLKADGITAMGEALHLVAEQLSSSKMEDRALPPVLVLISDGQPTDDFESGLNTLMNQRWGQKAVRLAIALGHDANLDVLQYFINPTYDDCDQTEGLEQKSSIQAGRKPLQASNATALAKYIEWASTAVVGAASMPVTLTEEATGENIPIPDLPPTMIDEMHEVGPVIW